MPSRHSVRSTGWPLVILDQSVISFDTRVVVVQYCILLFQKTLSFETQLKAVYVMTIIAKLTKRQNIWIPNGHPS